jgi:hypothetical protein
MNLAPMLAEVAAEDRTTNDLAALPPPVDVVAAAKASINLARESQFFEKNELLRRGESRSINLNTVRSGVGFVPPRTAGKDIRSQKFSITSPGFRRTLLRERGTAL